MIVRYADDSVLGFESKRDVDRFLEDTKVRFAQFGLTLNERGQDACAAVRSLRGPGARQARACKAADVRLPRVHSHLWEVPIERLVD
ncbi:hypothetical protein [Variovorax sp. SRS16]|uniref:hypothetical protein n=1 Tax=Variovorax sp. SRS16 TaxID=282217 RepID=UPI0013A590F9|nr:hypothetical protein [Variovorax sp. SRS16]